MIAVGKLMQCYIYIMKILERYINEKPPAELRGRLNSV